MDDLIALITGFHDSLAKEIHLINRAWVDRDASMAMTHRFDVQVLIQSQWEPYGLELLCAGIEELHLGSAHEYWDGVGRVQEFTAPVQRTRISLSLDESFQIVCSQLFYRIRGDWLGKQAFLKTEVPSPDAIAATPIKDDWRQCSGCMDAWQERPDAEFSICPSCLELTQLIPN